MTYDIGPCTCGHTTTVEAKNKEEALEKALDQSPQHIAEFHADDPDRAKLEAMSREELTEMMRPLVHEATASEPAFREKIE